MCAGERVDRVTLKAGARTSRARLAAIEGSLPGRALRSSEAAGKQMLFRLDRRVARTTSRDVGTSASVRPTSSLAPMTSSCSTPRSMPWSTMIPGCSGGCGLRSAESPFGGARLRHRWPRRNSARRRLRHSFTALQDGGQVGPSHAGAISRIGTGWRMRSSGGPHHPLRLAGSLESSEIEALWRECAGFARQGPEDLGVEHRKLPARAFPPPLREGRDPRTGTLLRREQVGGARPAGLPPQKLRDSAAKLITVVSAF